MTIKVMLAEDQNLVRQGICNLLGLTDKIQVVGQVEDGSEVLDGIQRYQSMIGALQWAVSLGRFDIMTAVMTLSAFRAAPRVGHLERAKRIYGYLCKFKHAALRVRTAEPDYSALPEQDFEKLSISVSEQRRVLSCVSLAPLSISE